MTKPRIAGLIVVCLILSFSTLAAASESISCAGAISTLVPDGRIVHSTIPAATTFFWEFSGLAGRSYSVEIMSELDNVLPVDTFQVYNTVDDCTQPTTSLTLNSNTGADPGLFTSGLRRTFIAPNDGFYIIRMGNSGGTGHNYTLRVTDTTLYNPRWSTYSGFSTQYGFKNTTNTDIDVSLVVTTILVSPTPVTLPAPILYQFTVPANQEVFVYLAPAATVDIPHNHAGFSSASHNGPPGGIIADAYMISANATVVTPSSFEPRNAAH